MQLLAAIFFLCLSPVSAAGLAEVRVVVPALPTQLDPHKAASFVDRAIASELFLGLVTRDAVGTLVPGAATWQVSADGLTYTFTLKDALKWSDGKAVEAGDFVAGFTRARDPATAAPFAADLAAIITAEAPDAKTVKIVLAQSSASLIENLSHPVAAPVPRHRMSDAWAQPPTIVTNGAVLAQADNGLTLVTPTARVTFRTADSADEAASLVRDGTADLTLGFGFENPAAPKTDPAQNLYCVAVNTGRAPLNVREVRHALAMAIDRDAILKTLKIENAVAAYAVVPPAAYGETAHGIAPYSALQAEMRAAIAEVLLSERKIDPAHPATLTLIYPKGTVHSAVAKSLAAGWVTMGVHIRAQEHSMADYLQTLRDGAFDLALAVGENVDPRPLVYLTPFLHADPRNITRYADQDFKDRMHMAEAAADPAHHLVLLSEADAVLIEDQPALPIFFFSPMRPVAQALKGWTPNAAGYHPLHALSR
jgi:oligopeptide transport system substrate-binding protein